MRYVRSPPGGTVVRTVLSALTLSESTRVLSLESLVQLVSPQDAIRCRVEMTGVHVQCTYGSSTGSLRRTCWTCDWDLVVFQWDETSQHTIILLVLYFEKPKLKKGVYFHGSPLIGSFTTIACSS